MLEAFLVFVLGLMPPLASLFLLKRLEIQARDRLRVASLTTANRRVFQLQIIQELDYNQATGYAVGDTSCRFNARSAYLRCAVNPGGPCQACRYHEPLS